MLPLCILFYHIWCLLVLAVICLSNKHTQFLPRNKAYSPVALLTLLFWFFLLLPLAFFFFFLPQLEARRAEFLRQCEMIHLLYCTTYTLQQIAKAVEKVKISSGEMCL